MCKKIYSYTTNPLYIYIARLGFYFHHHHSVDMITLSWIYLGYIIKYLVCIFECISKYPKVPSDSGVPEIRVAGAAGREIINRTAGAPLRL